MEIHYTIVDSPLGRLLVGATDRGVSALYLGESDARSPEALMNESAKFSRIHGGRSRTSIFRPMCRARRSSAASGKSCA